MVDQFLELAVHIKLASEVVLQAAEQLPVLGRTNLGPSPMPGPRSWMG